MTTADYQEYVVVCKEGADCDSLWQDIENFSASPTVPDRPISIADNRDDWSNMCNYWLTSEEVELLRKDPRVDDVAIPLKNLPNTFHLHLTQIGNFNKPQNVTNSSGLAVNWGLIRHSFDYNVYGSQTTTDRNYQYILDGSGVDVVIWDSGIQVDHPELQNAAGQSRVKTINWYTAAGETGNLPANFYTDINGHGTACAGIVAGKTFGWAKNADIYAMNSVPFVDGRSINIETAARLIRKWHERKNNPANGPGIYTGRPTVVNASFGQWLEMQDYVLVGGRYRGSTWISNNWITHWESKGINPTYGRVPLWSTESNGWLQLMQNAGIIICHSAGNEGYKASEISNNPNDDSNNFLTVIGGSVFYMRGSSPYASKTINVGAIDTFPKTANQDKKVNYSNAGSLVKVYGASGGDAQNLWSVMTSTSTTNTYGTWAQPYRGSGTFKQVYFSGTSCACPQIAGIAALYMQANPRATPTNVYDWFTANASKNSLYKTGLDSDYTNMESQWGGDGGVAYQALQSLTWKPATISVTGSTTTVAVRVWNGSTWQPAYPFTT